MDHKEQDNKNTASRHFHPLQFAILACIFVLIITGIISHISNPPKSLIVPPQPKGFSIKTIKETPWIKLTVQKGDSLSTVFNRANLSLSDYNAIIQLPKAKQSLTNLKPGQHLYLLLDQNRKIKKLIYMIDHANYLEVSSNKNGFEENIIAIELTKKKIISKGTIHQSFISAALGAKLSSTQAMALTRIFEGDINFSHDTQPGDQFKVLYDAYFDHNKEVKTGDILAAEFINRNKKYYAIQYETARGTFDYFFPSGKNMRRAFLRAPIHYKYISSPFNAKRMHPILHIIRPHEGVDLAAPTGTPIHASSDGKIIFRGRRGGYGKCIIIRNTPRISTRFAHLSRFSPMFHDGSYVKEGQIIGYVGQTGLATGPHLHYEFRINGIPRNPMTVKLPSANPVPRKELPAFKAYAKLITNELNSA